MKSLFNVSLVDYAEGIGATLPATTITYASFSIMHAHQSLDPLHRLLLGSIWCTLLAKRFKKVQLIHPVIITRGQLWVELKRLKADRKVSYLCKLRYHRLDPLF